MKKILLSFLLLFMATISYAQVGYQVSLLNTATGEPRANETVSCNVTLTNSEGGVVYSGTQSATSNDFGVISLNVGDATMFDNMDWSKLPLFVEVSVDGKLIGKSQVLSVPVAEYAKKTGVLNWEILSKANVIVWTDISNGFHTEYIFNNSSLVVRDRSNPEYTYTSQYHIEGNCVAGFYDTRFNIRIPFIGLYIEQTNTLYIVE